MISWKKIKQDSEMREMYLSGFSHGYSNVVRLEPSYLKSIYDRGYNDGQKRKVEIYFSMIEENEKNVERTKSITRS